MASTITPPATKDHERYKSTVIHIPQHIVDSSEFIEDDSYLALGNSPSENQRTSKKESALVHANAKSIVVVDELAQFLTLEEAPHPTVPCVQNISSKTQTTLLWSMVALFSISILISTLILAQNSITIIYIIQIMTALSGMILAYIYNANLHFTYSLSNKIDDLLSEQKQLKKQLEQQSADAVHSESIPLLESFRRGFMHKELQYCDAKDIKQLLPVIAHTLCELPFGLTQFRSHLFVILANRISTDPYLDQSWRFFLNSYGDVPSIRRIWENHEYLRKDTDDDDDDEYKSDEAIDCVKWFKSLFKDLNEIGSTKVNSGKYLCDPINGNTLVKVQLREIIQDSQNIIDCYTLNDKMSSTFVLKRDEDLRAKLAVILMFKYLNAIWREHRIMYVGEQCEVMTFEVVPMAVDFGCIEYTPIDRQNAHKLSDIDKEFSESVINKLMATAAGAYVASYICGVNIADRDCENIFIRNDGTLFHSDFCYVSDNDDATSFAISNHFVSAIGNDKWNEFVDIAVQCFSVLRKNYIHILDYSRIVFGFTQKSYQNEKYLKQSLFINIKEEKEALDAIKNVFNN